MLNWPKFFFVFGLLALLIAVLYIAGIYFSLFWLLPWFDIPMHILGGFWVSLAVLAIWFSFKKSIPENKIFFFILILATLIVGIFWEIFEYYFDIAFPGKEGYLYDTIKDLFDDLVGATLAFYYLKKKTLEMLL
ncbi:MAG: hypothetical protein Q7S34_02015 [bacterium]|nr:hypothetical protein [bacterium]